MSLPAKYLGQLISHDYLCFESCGTSEPGQCDGNFGYIELPTPIYHPTHVSELKRMLSLLCLKCLKMKKIGFPGKSSGIAERLLASCCEDSPQVTVREVKTTDGALYLELKAPSKSRIDWHFLERYGFRYGEGVTRTLLPSEVAEVLKRIPQDTRKKLAAKAFFPQESYILSSLPVPPNCLSAQHVSDGMSAVSRDPSMAMLKKILRLCEIIRSSRSGTPNFKSHEVEAIELQSIILQYFEVRGTSKGPNDASRPFGDSGGSSNKAWLGKMKTLFISKGSGFSSRRVITGDSYKRVNEIGIPFEIAQGITFEERVTVHSIKYLQELVDKKLCLAYWDGEYSLREGSNGYSLREGSTGHTFLRHGQIVRRRIMDGDHVFVNRPPSTQKHCLQALYVYVHDDHTVKINLLICGLLGADFDGDAIHVFYPQSTAAKAEVLELLSVEKQLLTSHNGTLNLQLATDSTLSLKLLFKSCLLDRAVAQQLAMFVYSPLPPPAVLKSEPFKPKSPGPFWTTLQMLQTSLPPQFDCEGDRYLIKDSDFLKIYYTREAVQSVTSEIVHSIFFEKGPEAVLKFLDLLQPMLMEHVNSEGFSVSLEDFYISKPALDYIYQDIKVISPLIGSLRSTYDERAEMQLENHIHHAKSPISKFILKSSGLGVLIDAKSESAVDKIVQQVGFLGLQISDRGKFYSKTLVEDIACHFDGKYNEKLDYPSLQHGLVEGCFFTGLDPFEVMVHSISAREAMVRSSRGLAEPGTLFKKLMAFLRDVVICYDGTVRNVCSNSIIQFEYGTKASESLFPACEHVGVLAATAISNPAYKAVLDSTPKSTSTWELMKEVLLCRVNFKNDLTDRRDIIYLNYCTFGRKYCRENGAMLIKNHLKKASLRDATVEFLIEYKSLDVQSGLAGHLHLNKEKMKEWNINIQDVLHKCQEKLTAFQKNKKNGNVFKGKSLSVSECCCFHHSGEDKPSGMPCLVFFGQDLERPPEILADWICPVLLDTIIKGDPRVFSVNIIWVAPKAPSWINNRSSKNQKSEIAVEIVVEKAFVKGTGDAWRVALNSCLPLLHLIDTTCSVPYAIKQVEELLGISASFNLAVQRLSTMIRSVSRGLLKEHLILLANSMTSAGNLIGFTTGGFKAFARLLNIQVPFTEATHFTPRKTFDRAAEKCHVDSLQSIVASCAWGKHVALGTGTLFDILLDDEVGFKQVDQINVYDFLNVVRSTKGEDPNTGCLGVDLDELDFEDDNMDWNLSPAHEGSEKPVFEDMDESRNVSAGWGTEMLIKHKRITKQLVDGGILLAGDPSLRKKLKKLMRALIDWMDAADIGWGTKQDLSSAKAMEENVTSGGWGSKKQGSAPIRAEEKENVVGWGSKNSGGDWIKVWKASGNECSNAWGMKSSVQTTGNDDSGAWGFDSDGGGWGANAVKSKNKSDAWGARKKDSFQAQDENKGSEGWGTPTGSGWRAFDSGWGSSSQEQTRKRPWGNSDWKSMKECPPRNVNDSNVPGLVTVTGKRLDSFTSEEQKIFSTIEPLMQSVQNIMNNSRYNDGDTLSAEHQAFIVENVLNYRPEKARKIGAGIDHLLVNKHTSFESTSCFFVASTDGVRQDFSYRKCLENFVKEKYPDFAQDFNSKYFSKES
ncbi:DNA-directed RNA polymerase V subunit 1-like [Rutidosis leptorrhynchoides]|uniref:DNA-directed RNA polymerase V subunit 1-like n=1 Tax=Rutidosis leptorrhynchoides TaxID=125765 RepID=UPI003A99600E